MSNLLEFRAEYDPKNDLLDEEFMLKGKWYQRKDLEVQPDIFKVMISLKVITIILSIF